MRVSTQSSVQAFPLLSRGLAQVERKPTRRARAKKTRRLRPLGIIVPMPSASPRSRPVALRTPGSASVEGTPPGTKEQELVMRHWREYLGRWVAVDGSRLVGEANNAREALEKARASGHSSPFLVHVTEPSNLPFGGW